MTRSLPNRFVSRSNGISRGEAGALLPLLSPSLQSPNSPRSISKRKQNERGSLPFYDEVFFFSFALAKRGRRRRRRWLGRPPARAGPPPSRAGYGHERANARTPRAASVRGEETDGTDAGKGEHANQEDAVKQRMLSSKCDRWNMIHVKLSRSTCIFTCFRRLTCPSPSPSCAHL